MQALLLLDGEGFIQVGGSNRSEGDGGGGGTIRSPLLRCRSSTLQALNQW